MQKAYLPGGQKLHLSTALPGNMPWRTLFYALQLRIIVTQKLAYLLTVQPCTTNFICDGLRCDFYEKIWENLKTIMWFRKPCCSWKWRKKMVYVYIYITQYQTYIRPASLTLDQGLLVWKGQTKLMWLGNSSCSSLAPRWKGNIDKVW